MATIWQAVSRQHAATIMKTNFIFSFIFCLSGLPTYTGNCQNSLHVFCRIFPCSLSFHWLHTKQPGGSSFQEPMAPNTSSMEAAKNSLFSASGIRGSRTGIPLPCLSGIAFPPFRISLALRNIFPKLPHSILSANSPIRSKISASSAVLFWNRGFSAGGFTP